MKRFIYLLPILLLAIPVHGQAILRNNFTTNQNPVVSSTLVSVPFNSRSGLIVEGDSLMAGAGKVYYQLTNNFPAWRSFGMVSNYALSGSTIGDLTNRWTTNAAPAIAAMKSSGITNIYLLFDSGANDLNSNADSYCVAWSNYVSTAKSSNVTVIAFSVLPQTNIYPVANWFKINTFIRENILPDYLVDWARLMPIPSDTNWFIDGVHLTANGYLRSAYAVNASILGAKNKPTDATGDLSFGTNGFVGINTTDPLFQLHVTGNTTNTGSVFAGVGMIARRNDRLAFYAPNGGFYSEGNVSNFMFGALGIGAINPIEKLHVIGNTTNSGSIYVGNGVTAHRSDRQAFYAPFGGVYTEGNVSNHIFGALGIGITTPASKLDVIGDIRSSSIITATNGFYFPQDANIAPTAAFIGGTVGSVTNHLLKNVGGSLIDYWSDGTTLWSKQIAP